MASITSPNFETTVFGLFANRIDIERAINELLRAGFKRNEIDLKESAAKGFSMLMVHEPIVYQASQVAHAPDWINGAQRILNQTGAEIIASATESGGDIT